MLSFRMVIFSAASGICLWGLFTLLDTLKQPELLRSAKAIVVKGCEPAASEEATQLCPQLYCQKALLDAKALPLRARFTVTIDRIEAGPPRMIRQIAGTARTPAGEEAFACVLEEHRVLVNRRLSASELANLTRQPGRWEF